MQPGLLLSPHTTGKHWQCQDRAGEGRGLCTELACPGRIPLRDQHCLALRWTHALNFLHSLFWDIKKATGGVGWCAASRHRPGAAGAQASDTVSTVGQRAGRARSSSHCMRNSPESCQLLCPSMGALLGPRPHTSPARAAGQGRDDAWTRAKAPGAARSDGTTRPPRIPLLPPA